MVFRIHRLFLYSLSFTDGIMSDSLMLWKYANQPLHVAVGDPRELMLRMT